MLPLRPRSQPTGGFFFHFRVDGDEDVARPSPIIDGGEFTVGDKGTVADAVVQGQVNKLRSGAVSKATQGVLNNWTNVLTDLHPDWTGAPPPAPVPAAGVYRAPPLSGGGFNTPGVPVSDASGSLRGGAFAPRNQLGPKNWMGPNPAPGTIPTITVTPKPGLQVTRYPGPPASGSSALAVNPLIQQRPPQPDQNQNY